MTARCLRDGRVFCVGLADICVVVQQQAAALARSEVRAMNKRWIVVAIIAAAIGFALGVVVFTAILGASDRQIDILKILAPFLALLAAWGMWLYDQRKRHDPVRQEVYRQQLALLPSLAARLHRLVVAAALEIKHRTPQTHETYIEADIALSEFIARETLLMPNTVREQIDALLTTSVELHNLLRRDAPCGERLAQCYERLLRAVHALLVAIHESLGLERAEIDFVKWWR